MLINELYCLKKNIPTISYDSLYNRLYLLIRSFDVKTSLLTDAYMIKLLKQDEPFIIKELQEIQEVIYNYNLTRREINN